MRRWAAALVLGLSILVGLPGVAAASSAPASLALPALPGPDCHGEAPFPSSPTGHFGVRPAVISSADPFTTPGVSLQSVYGSNYRWWWYDNGCSPEDAIMPSLGTNIGNFVGLELPGLGPSWGRGLYDAVISPDAWIGAVDQPVREVTASVSNGVWFTWIAVSLTLVALITILRSRHGQISGSITAVGWALLVLTVVTWTVRYPVESVKLFDQGVQTAVGAVSTGFSPPVQGPPGPGSDQATQSAAKKAIDGAWDTITRDTVYRTWSEGVFGSSDSATAAKFGPQVFKATHFSWSEYDTYLADPAGKGKEVVDAKATSFRQLAEQLKSEDPLAYDYFTGNRYGERIGTATLGFASTLLVVLFLIVSGVLILLAYLIYRLAIPMAPAAGVVFLFDTVREAALGAMKKVARPIIMGPVYFLASLVVLKFFSGILDSQMAYWLKLVCIGLVGGIVWKLLKPMAMIPKIPARGFLSMLAAVKLGSAPRSRKNDEDEEGEKRPSKPDPDHAELDQQPVYTPMALTRERHPASATPRWSESAPAEEYERPTEAAAGPAPIFMQAQTARTTDQSGHPAPLSLYPTPLGLPPGADVAVAGSASGGRTARELSAGVAAAPYVDDAAATVSPEGPPSSVSGFSALPAGPIAVGAGSDDAHPVGSDEAAAGPDDARRPVASDVAAGADDARPVGSDAAAGLDSGASQPLGRPVVRDAATQRESQEPSPLMDGRIVDPGEDLPHVNESNLTYDAEGQRVFMVYTPEGSKVHDAHQQ